MSRAKLTWNESKEAVQIIVLTLQETAQVSGGGSNVRHENSGGEPASYNIHTSPAGAGPAWYNLA